MIFVLTLLVFGLAFFLLMSWGCGGALVHGRELVESTHLRTDVDPVCGMRVAKGDGLELTFEGHTVRFCSVRCKQKFERHPEAYSSRIDPEGGPR